MIMFLIERSECVDDDVLITRSKYDDDVDRKIKSAVADDVVDRKVKVMLMMMLLIERSKCY